MDFRLHIWPRYVLKWDGDERSLTLLEGAILTRLYHSPADLLQLTDSLYDHREDGGPNDPDNVIAVTICRLRKKLVNSPVAIGHTWGKQYYIKIGATIDRISTTIIDEGMENPTVATNGEDQ